MPTLAFDDGAKYTYDLANWPHESYHRLTFDSFLTSDTFTIASTTEVQRVVDAFDGTDRRTVDDFPTIAMDATVLTILHEGNDQDFSRFQQFMAPVDLIIDKIAWNFAMGLDVTAYTNGNFELLAVRIELSSYKAPGQRIWQTDVRYPTPNFTAMTAVDNQYVVVNSTFPGPIPVYQGGMLEIRIYIDSDVSGTGTERKGIIPVFPYQATGGVRTYSESGFKMYVRPMARDGGSVISSPTRFATFARDNPQGEFTGPTTRPSPDRSGGLNT